MNPTQLSLLADSPQTDSPDQTLSSVGHRARALVSLVSGLALRIPGSAGRRPYVLLAICGPDGSYLKTHGDSPLRRRDGSSVPYTGRSTRWDIAWAGELGALPNLERRTGGTASSSSDGWPTPSAMNPNETEDLAAWQARRQRIKDEHKNGNGFGTPLGVAVRLWPSPRATDGEKGGPNQRGSKDDLMLPSAVQMWATPKSSPSGPDYARIGRPDSGGDDLVTQIARLQASARPSPAATDHKGSSKPGNSVRDGQNLRTAVQPRLWRTPQARDGQRGTQPTEKRLAGGHAPGLDDQVEKTWPSPAATDHKGSSKPGQRRGQLIEATEVPMATMYPAPRLNPRWTLQLMGLPADWLDVPYQPKRRG